MSRPDILFVMTDQQRFDTIAALGELAHLNAKHGSAGAKRSELFECVRDLPGLRGRALQG